MRILVVSHAYVERDNHKKLQILSAQKDVDLAVIYPSKWRTWHGEEKVESSKLRVESSYQEFPLKTIFFGDGGKYFYNPIQLIISLVKFWPDLVYLEEEPFTPVALEISFLSWFLRSKIVFFTWENIDLPLGFVRKLTEKFVFWSAAGGIAGSQEAQQRIRARGFKKESVVIPQFGVDTSVFRRSLLIKETPSAGVVVGFVGRPTMAKGLDVLMKAVSRLTFDFVLLIVTSSREIPDEILSLSKTLAIEDKVKFKTSIPHPELPNFFNKMDIFVLPSRTTPTWKEQFGRTLVEAMACGVPVVGSSSGAIPEVIGEAGLIFNENDPVDLANKLKDLVDAKIRSDLSQKAEERVKNLFTNEVLSEKLSNFLIKFSPAQNK